MTRGLDRRQIGVSDAMLESYGDMVFSLSNNAQKRVGDPIRLGQWDEVARQKPQLGLSDAQIAARLGLTEDQVTYIRNHEEIRRMRRNNFQRLLELGGGRRFRAERFQPHEERFRFGEDAMSLKDSMRFDPERARHYFDQGWWTEETLRQWLAIHVAERPDHPAIVHGERVVSYAELGDLVDRLAGALWRLGVRRGDVVAVQLPNIAEYLVSYLAICQMGAAMTTVYMPHRASEYLTLLGHSKARAIVCMSDAGGFAAAETLVGLQPQLPALEHVIALGAPVAGTQSFEALLAAGDSIAGNADAVPVAADPMVLLYTSGTTASPKGAPHNYHMMLSNARLGVPEHGLGPDDVILSAAPYGHLFGLYSLTLAMCVGATNLMLPMFSPPALAETIEAGRPSVMLAAPAHVAACVGAGLFDRFDIASLKLVIMSGSAVPPDLAKTFDEKLVNGAVNQLWGMTELQAGMYARPGDSLEVATATAGRPPPGAEVRVVDEDDQPVAPGVEGHLQARGCHVIPGYLDNADANADAFTADGWFRSGDLAVRDAAGNTAITGRSKEIINRGGVKYNPRDVEDLLDKHPKIAQSAIVPMPDDVLGERACCFAVAAEGETPTLAELCDYLLSHDIAKIKLPERLELIEDMPLTPTRKVIKGRLVARLGR